MDIKKAKIAYSIQKSNAARRGIGWELTFEQWLAWWGDDLDMRGVGPTALQMQRFADTGPYRLDNIRKGTPTRNAKTRGDMRRKLHAEQAAILRQAMLDAAIHMPSADSEEELTEDEQEMRKLSFVSSGLMRYRNGL